MTDHFLQGVAVFVIGTLIQFWAHFSLARLASRVQRVREAAMQAATLGGGSEAARRAGMRKRPLAPRKQHTDKPDWGSSNGTKAEDSNSPQAADGAETSAAGTEEKPGTEGGMFDEYVTDVRVKGVAGGHYAAPKGGLFEWVSCPHYFGEIVIYGGLALVTRGAPGPLLALAWVVSETTSKIAIKCIMVNPGQVQFGSGGLDCGLVGLKVSPWHFLHMYLHASLYQSPCHVLNSWTRTTRNTAKLDNTVRSAFSLLMSFILIGLLFMQMINLVLAADATHIWYKENFPEYPRRRRALIPFLY